MPVSNPMAAAISGVPTPWYYYHVVTAGRTWILGIAVPLEVTQKRRRGDSLLIE